MIIAFCLIRALAMLGSEEQPSVRGTALLVEQLQRPEPAARRAAALSLGKMGKAGAAAAPGLRDVLHRPAIVEGSDDVNAAAWALGQIGSAGIAILIEELRNHHEAILEPVIDGLVASGKVAVPTLTAALGEENDFLRDSAAQALGGIGPAAKDAVPSLISAASHRSVRDMPIWALGQIGPVTDEIVPFLARQLSDPNEGRRLGACSALGQIGPPSAQAVLPLAELLQDTSDTVRASAAGTLGRIGDGAKDAVSALLAATNDPNPYVRSEVAKALKRIAGAE